MEQYIPETLAYARWNPLTCICRGVRYVLFHSDHSITRRGFQLTYAVVSGMYCSILIPLHMYVGILFLWYCDQNGTVHTWHPCICKLESSSCDTVIRMEQYILITLSQEEDPNLHMQGCQVCTVSFWSQYHKKRIPTYICIVILWSEWNSTYLTPLHM
jgi:hypothetical protein